MSFLLCMTRKIMGMWGIFNMTTITIGIPSAKTLKAGITVTRDVRAYFVFRVYNPMNLNDCKLEFLEQIEFSCKNGKYCIFMYNNDAQCILHEKFNKLNDVKEFLNHMLNRKERFEIV